jgi:hypothetical protein
MREQSIDIGIPSYEQLLSQRQSDGKSTSRKSYYWDILLSLPEQQRFQLFRLFIDELEPHAKDEVDALRSTVFGGGYAVPITIVPIDLWNSEKLNNSLRDIDHAVDAQHYNRATTLAYTCLEGLYKTYIQKHVPACGDLTDSCSSAKLSRVTSRRNLELGAPSQNRL